MAFLRQYIAPLIAVIIFLVALVVVSARTFLPSGLSSPAPTEDLGIVIFDNHLSSSSLRGEP